MNSLVLASFVINVLVAGSLGLLLFFKLLPRITRVYGEDTPARQILSCLYLSIAMVSMCALLFSSLMVPIAVVLFPLQIIYKLLTLLAVKDRRNPVPWWNLAISIILFLSLISISWSA
jgi:hypothetical protein